MPLKFRSLIAPLALATSLASCHGPKSDTLPPLSKQAMAAVSEKPGAPREELARAVDALFTAKDVGETRAVVVMENGRIVAERYAPGYTRDTRLVSWSMAKTITSVMIGMLVADGRLSLDQPAPIPRWQRPGDPRGAITLRYLLQMRSGLQHTEAGPIPYESSEVRMLFLDGRDNMAQWAEEQPLETVPGSEFKYSTNTTVILSDIAARVLTNNSNDPETRRRAVYDYLKARLFDPLGMTSVVPEFDRSGTLIGGSLMHATARDFARFGELLRNKGSYRGAQIVPRSWVVAMTTPSPKSPQYGLQTWLNNPVKPGADDALFPKLAPHSLFGMVGHMGQYVLVSPRQGLTMVRLGHSDEKQRAALKPLMADVIDLYPER
ncbi:serine hydrolase [Porphyrobacter algicida]|uniref:Serine hydrolase n=1 Tax=Qipengyuania algicida TaxID=1836209 RepID=A0A845AHA8_9SPHN|nr:serine hydrolase [Qipengyuania algicida]MXP27946.1 serine hydrolase [Qipengyuania algicida]